MHIHTWFFFPSRDPHNSMPMIHRTGGGLYEFANSTEVMNFSIMKSTSCFVSKNLSLKDLIWCLFLVFFGVVLTDGQRCAKDGQFLHLISFF